MKKEDVVAFFDECADSWDSNMVRDEAVIEEILNLADISKGKRVLDVACGTGVLFPDYIKREAQCVTGIDISSEMVKIAKGKFPEFEIICADAEEYSFGESFDCIMIYNAFPHFVNSKKLFANLAAALKTGGRLSVAHGMSRERLIMHHSGKASKISNLLPETDALCELMKEHFDVDVMISNSRMYMVSAVKK